jgi:hypothetical protein
MIMFTIQALDYDEGSAARWFELKNSRHNTKESAREHLKRIRATEDEDSMYNYRIVKVNSPEYYSQPTDKLEY